MGTLYGHNLGCDEPFLETQMATHLIQIEIQLAEWQSALPPDLQLRSSDSLPLGYDLKDPILEKFHLVLSLRYLSTRLLLYRPCLTKSLKDDRWKSRGSPNAQFFQVGVHTAFERACVRAAEEIIDIVHLVLHRPGLGRNLLGAWWFNVYYGMSNPFINSLCQQSSHSQS